MKYTIFGKMIDGEETLDAIEKVLIDPKVNFYCFRNRPFFEIPILTDLFEQFFFCATISRELVKIFCHPLFITEPFYRTVFVVDCFIVPILVQVQNIVQLTDT